MRRPAPLPVQLPSFANPAYEDHYRRSGSTSRPPPGHPERLCPEVPLSEAEKTWGRQLLEVPGADV